jgi:hypothetical protein
MSSLRDSDAAPSPRYRTTSTGTTAPRHRGPTRAEGKVKRSLPVFLASAALLGGCASAGGTAGIFDTRSVWYKHPTRGDVKECGGGFPGVQIGRYNCGKALQAQGYVEEGLPSEPWVLWRPALDSAGQRAPNQWSPIRGFVMTRRCSVSHSWRESHHRCSASPTPWTHAGRRESEAFAPRIPSFGCIARRLRQCRRHRWDL